MYSAVTEKAGQILIVFCLFGCFLFFYPPVAMYTFCCFVSNLINPQTLRSHAHMRTITSLGDADQAMEKPRDAL